MKKVILVIAMTLPLWAQVKITQQGKEKISVEIDGKPFTDFYIGPETAKPYLYPLRTADGKIVTRGFPMVTDVPGEIHDHPHHRGLWFTHGDVNGYDFWGNEPDQKGARSYSNEWTSSSPAKSPGPSRQALRGRSLAGRRCSSKTAR
jgi:hypothetical protein